MGLIGAGDETVADSLVCEPASGSGSLLIFPPWGSASAGGKGDERQRDEGFGLDRRGSVCKSSKEEAILL